MNAKTLRTRTSLFITALALAACQGTNTPATECASGSRWSGGNSPSPYMNPGLACIDCHDRMSGAPRLRAAGTVYQTANQPDLCDGLGGATVEIIDANGSVTALTTNSAGNFYTTGSLTFPIRARVRTATGTREMIDAVPTGDCNSCHTVSGANGAPGRISPL